MPNDLPFAADPGNGAPGNGAPGQGGAGRGGAGRGGAGRGGAGRGELEAILLVGGQGTRLRPLTITTPKPLLPTAGVPFLAHQLAKAAASGITRVVLATSYRAEMFADCFGDGASSAWRSITSRSLSRSAPAAESAMRRPVCAAAPPIPSWC